jgi:hypothetical protein
MSFDDLKDITRYVEEKTGFTHITRRLPDFTSDENGLYCCGVHIDGSGDTNWNIKNYIKYIQTSVFSFYITIDNTDIIYNNLHFLIDGLPSSEMFNVILYCNDCINEEKIVSILENNESDNLLQRINIFHDWKNGLRIKLYQVLDSFGSYEKARESYECIVPLLRITRKNIHDLDKLADCEDNVLLSAGIFPTMKNKLAKFADSPESLAFEDIDAQKEFYTMIGLDYIQLPFNFKIMRI